MSAIPCPGATPLSTLIEYWLGELDAAGEAQIEEHLFGCAECSSRLHNLAQLGEGIRRETRQWSQLVVLPAPFVKRLQNAGARVREYSMQPGGSVACTVAPADDMVIAHLHAPLHDVQRLDLVFEDLPEGTRTRLEDVAFDRAADEVVLAPNVMQLRQLTWATQRVQLFSIENGTEREIAAYTFNHSPHQ